jgi:hypothetical protein
VLNTNPLPKLAQKNLHLRKGLCKSRFRQLSVARAQARESQGIGAPAEGAAPGRSRLKMLMNRQFLQPVV